MFIIQFYFPHAHTRFPQPRPDLRKSIAVLFEGLQGTKEADLSAYVADSQVCFFISFFILLMMFQTRKVA